MNTNGWGRGVAGTLVALALLAAGMARTPAADARALVKAAGADEARWEESPGEPGDEADRWWGVLGAVLCGGEIRLILRAPAIGMNPYALAAGIAGCSLAALDVMTTQ
jgi:hypothetical protein